MTNHRMDPPLTNKPAAYQSHQAQHGSAPTPHQAPTFQHPHRDMRADMQQQAPQGYAPARQAYNSAPASGPAPLSHGGQGPLSGFAPVSAAPFTPNASEAAHFGDAAPHLTRPSFPAAPSKVLQEQQAMGGDGHIRYTEEAPAFEAPAYQAQMLEGVYPHPDQQPQATYQQAQAPDQTYAPAQPEHNPGYAGAAPLASQAEAAQRPTPRLQHAEPVRVSGDLAGAEPIFGEEPHALSAGAAASNHSATGAFMNFEGGNGQVEEGRARNLPWFLILLGLIVLLALLAFGAWAQYRNAQSAATLAPVQVSAPAGPERIVPEERGGLMIENTDSVVLNNDDLRADGTLDVFEAVPEPVIGTGFVPNPIGGPAAVVSTDDSVQILEDFGVGQGAAVTTLPSIDAPTAAVSQAGPTITFEAGERPTTVPARNPVSQQAAPTPAPAATQDVTQPTPAPAAVVSDANLITTEPSSGYVQVGSFGSLDAAKARFAQLSARSNGQFGGITPRYWQAQVNGATRYRTLLLGFDSSAAAGIVAGRMGLTQDDAWLVKNF